MSEDIRKQIYQSLNLQETEALLEIWQANDRVEWTETAFDVLRGILQARLEELPQQNPPVFEHPEVQDAELEQSEDDEDGPVFYKPKDVVWLARWLDWVAIASIVFIFINSIQGMDDLRVSVSDLFRFPQSVYNIGVAQALEWLVTSLITTFLVALQSSIIYFSLKSLGTILKILMQMEFNSRKGE